MSRSAVAIRSNPDARIDLEPTGRRAVHIALVEREPGQLITGRWRAFARNRARSEAAGVATTWRGHLPSCH